MGYTSYLSGLAAGPMGVGSVMAVIFTGLTAKTLDLRAQTFLGLTIFAIGCFMFSELNLAIAINNVIIPNIVLGAGLTMVIIPTTTVLFSTVKNAEMTNASSVQNLIKNVGCAVGTSSVGFFVSRFSQMHQTYLVDRLTALNTSFATKIGTITCATENTLSIFFSFSEFFIRKPRTGAGACVRQMSLMSSGVSTTRGTY